MHALRIAIGETERILLGFTEPFSQRTISIRHANGHSTLR
jgi:hypothetical protein